MANQFLERYKAGHQSEVWTDLVALHDAVRNRVYLNDALAVATETMKRARHNVELIIPKLEKLGYKFGDPEEERSIQMMDNPQAHIDSILGGMKGIPENVAQSMKEMMGRASQSGFTPRTGHEAAMVQMQQQIETMRAHLAQRRAEAAPHIEARKKAVATERAKPVLENHMVFSPSATGISAAIDACEERLGGPLPISVRCWYEQVGGVRLDGDHETLNPANEVDSLMVLPFDHATQELDYDGGEGDEAVLEELIVPLWGREGDSWDVKLPDSGADAAILWPNHPRFVEHLRISFSNGGFPGWARGAKRRRRPEKELAYMCEGLLAI